MVVARGQINDHIEKFVAVCLNLLEQLGNTLTFIFNPSHKLIQPVRPALDTIDCAVYVVYHSNRENSSIARTAHR